MPLRAPAPRASWWLALVLSACGAACASGPEIQPEGPEVHKIRIEGARKLSPSELKKKILTSESGWGIWPFGQREYFDPNAWQADLRRIERYYQAQGYYQAEVLEDQVVPRGEDEVDLQVKVREGEPTTIDKLTVRGLDGLPRDQRAAVLEDLPFKVGDIFQEDDWTTAKAQVLSRLRDLGYANATVEGVVIVDTGKRTATVVLDTTPRQRFRFGKIFPPQGAEHVPAWQILSAAKGAIKEGAWYSESALAEAQARIFKMGVFGGVKVNRSAPDLASGTIRVSIIVQEAPFHTTRFGGGLGTDQTRSELHLLGEYTDRNFFGDLRRLTVRGRVGYAVLPDLITTLASGAPFAGQGQGIIGNVGVELEQPRFIFQDVRLPISFGLERDVQPAYQYYGGKARLGIIWQPHPAFSIYPSYNFEGYDMLGSAQAGAGLPPLVLGCPQVSANRPCILTLSYLEQIIEWDRRNDKVEPHRGYFLGVSFQEGGGPLGGGFTFLRVLPDARYYKSFGDDEQLTLSVRMRAGTLISPKTDAQGHEVSPIVSRFFSGGNNMRGFGDRRLSPMEVVTDARGQGQTVPIGGNGLFESSAELRYAVLPKLVVASFFDTGFVTTQTFQPSLAYIGQNMQYALGLGVRYLTPVGPIRFDIAWRLPINAANLPPVYQPSDLTPGARSSVLPVGCPSPSSCIYPYPQQHWLFGLGTTTVTSGFPESPFTFHFSIGEAF